MSAALLDVNVLLAMAWPDHIDHPSARQWFIANRATKWATCPLTEAGFVRLSAHPAVVSSPVTAKAAIEALKLICSSTAHTFWAQNSLLELLPEIRERLVGQQQLNDALLLDLTIRNGGRLVTMDPRVASLLPVNSPHHSVLEILATK